ncbi:hypothetical protein M9458_057954 [Cirrhinus mrigala]|uniref:Uncharacterized protein n=1 Tax=Cirrhinus mrigala TaxID=683832 RepID=A0ABD0MB73_CIRMR
MRPLHNWTKTPWVCSGERHYCKTNGGFHGKNGIVGCLYGEIENHCDQGRIRKSAYQDESSQRAEQPGSYCRTAGGRSSANQATASGSDEYVAAEGMEYSGAQCLEGAGNVSFVFNYKLLDDV